MTSADFAKVAWALLGEGIELMRGEAGESPRTDEWLNRVAQVREEYRRSREAARAEVEQLRAELAAVAEARDCYRAAAKGLLTNLQRTSREADARVLAMRDACAGIVHEAADGTAFGRTGLRALARAIERLPTSTGTAKFPPADCYCDEKIGTCDACKAARTSTGTASGASGDAAPSYDDLSRAISELGLLLAKYDKARAPQVDAIKAAVDKERERCVAWANCYLNDDELSADWLANGIRSGADAPGAVK